MARWNSQETFLYRLFDEDGVLLYIGISNAWQHRMQEHRRTQPWWDQVAHVFPISFPDRRSALDAEARAIRRERPLHNIVHASAELPGTAPTWFCDYCGERTPDGYLFVPDGDSQRFYAEKESWEARHDRPGDGLRLLSATDLASYPAGIRWSVACWDCIEGDSSLKACDYSVALSTATTWEELLGWAAHLMGKTWFADSDFDDVLRRVGAVD
jgi:hypothetical protein